MAGDEEGEVGLEEGMPWLPSHVLNEAIWDAKEFVKEPPLQQLHQRHSLPNKLAEEPHAVPQQSKSSPRPHGRTKYPIDCASGGGGMRAVFLDSGKKSCGTGVFLPRRAGSNSMSSNKPGCSPVLLPARVVQALKLDVHEMGLQISRRQDGKSNSSSGDSNSTKNKKGKDVSGQRCVVSRNGSSSSPEIFLPKEWTY